MLRRLLNQFGGAAATGRGARGGRRATTGRRAATGRRGRAAGGGATGARLGSMVERAIRKR